MTTHSDPLFDPLVIPATVTVTNAPTNTRLEALMLGIPEDLRRQIREERRELVEALREARPYVEEDEDGNLRTAKWAIDFLARIDAILAREGGKCE